MRRKKAQHSGLWTVLGQGRQLGGGQLGKLQSTILSEKSGKAPVIRQALERDLKVVRVWPW